MVKKRKKADKTLVFKWLAAILLTLLAGLLVMALAMGLKPEAQPKATEPMPREKWAGIDVSSHQGAIDWAQVAESGVEFAMIRLGYRGYDTGTLHIDRRAAENLVLAREAGLKIGAYFFSQALIAEEARQEAALALEVLSGIELDLPLAYDWEFVSESARTGAMTESALTECIHAFCGAVEQAGYGSMIYFNRELDRTLLNLNKVNRYPFWLAQYKPELDFRRPVTMWQYTDQGRVPGIEEAVDLNWYYPQG